jgi:hypothetical protein
MEPMTGSHDTVHGKAMAGRTVDKSMADKSSSALADHAFPMVPMTGLTSAATDLVDKMASGVKSLWWFHRFCVQ